MNDDQFEVLAGRVDAVAQLAMHVVAQLEIDRRIDGPKLCSSLEAFAMDRADQPGLGVAGLALLELVSQLNLARESRNRRELQH